MTPTEAFTNFVHRCLIAAKRDRYAGLASTEKGRPKILNALCHEFERAINPKSVRSRNYDNLWKQPCFVFHTSHGFGAEFATVREAYDALQSDDSWLILLTDGAAGIYRPESRWDDEKLIAG